MYTTLSRRKARAETGTRATPTPAETKANHRGDVVDPLRHLRRKARDAAGVNKHLFQPGALRIVKRDPVIRAQ